jgi:hypothetical protein
MASVRLSRVFLVFLLLYLSTWAGHYTSGDGSFKVAWAKSMLSRHSANIGVDGKVVYSKYGVGQSLLAIPPLLVADAVQAITGRRAEAVPYTLLFVFNGAALLTLVAAYLRRRYDATAVWTTLWLIGAGTIWWPYTKLDFSEPLILTSLFAGFLLMRSGRDAAGLAVASFAGLLKVEAFLAVGVIAVWWLLVSRPAGRRALALGASLVPAVLVHAISALVRAGGSEGAYYANEQFSTPLLLGLYGLLLSAGKSVLLFSPPLTLGLVGWRRFAGTPEGRQDAVLFAALATSQLLLYACWWDWSGDDAWGPRFLVPGVVLMTIPAVAALEWRRTALAVGMLGVSVQLLAVLLSPLDYVLMVRRELLVRTDGATGQSRPVDLEDLRYEFRYSQIAGHWLLLRYALGAAPPSDPSSRSAALRDAASAEVWRATARLDPIWFDLARRWASR